MVAIILIFLIVGAIAYFLKSAKAIALLIIAFLGIISIFTPFWPFILIGIFALLTVDKK